MDSRPHFLLLPLMSPGHLIPIIDIAKLLSQHKAIVTLVTTPLNALKISSEHSDNKNTYGSFRILTLRFPTLEAGLPLGCESMDRLSDRSLIKNFFVATEMLKNPFEELLRTLDPPPSCVVSGKNLGWTVETCKRFRIPRIFFDGMGSFAFCCTKLLEEYFNGRSDSGSGSDSDIVVVPGIPHRIELSMSKLPENLNRSSASTLDLAEVRDKMRAAEAEADGVIVNSFAELEGVDQFYVNEYKKRVKGERVWFIGPVSSVNQTSFEKSRRGHEKTSISPCFDTIQKWLDGHGKGSVIYACLGSICGLAPAQLNEIRLGLEASEKPYLLVIKKQEKEKTLELGLGLGFQNENKTRGLIVHGWAPQLSILSHPSIGAFLSHCGWNSTIEALSLGVPIVTCPLFAEQFVNEKLLTEILGVGVSAGVSNAVRWGKESEAGLVVKRDGVMTAVIRVLDGGDYEMMRVRERAREIRVLAERAVKSGGSSFIDIDSMINYVKGFVYNDNNIIVSRSNNK